MANCNDYTPPDLSALDGIQTIGSGDCAEQDSDFAEQLAAEIIEIGGAVINVFKLLGVHEQGQLIDLTGSGSAISSPPAISSLASYAFDNTANTFETLETGVNVFNSFIGYNFGTKKTSYGTEKYNPAAPVLELITTIKIKQGLNTLNRVIQARIEVSEDGGLIWKRIDVVNIPDTDQLETINIKKSAMYQMWRLVPTMFNGDTSNTPWIVEELEFINYQATQLSNIQDLFFMENRDRDYADNSIELKAQYDLIDVQTELTKFGIDLPQQFIMTFSFGRIIELLGRPIVIGDIIEIPAEAQYSADLCKVKKYLEVTDTAWSTEGYTPGWRPILYRVTAQPALATQETRDVLGSPNDWSALSDDDFLGGVLNVNTSAQETTEENRQRSKDVLPEIGTDTSEIDTLVIDQNNKILPEQSLNDFYAEDGIPPNGLPYTEGITFPVQPIAHKAYHRLNYDPTLNIPSKLYQWNDIKTRWLYVETDRRYESSSHSPDAVRVLESSTSRGLGD